MRRTGSTRTPVALASRALVATLTVALVVAGCSDSGAIARRGEPRPLGDATPSTTVERSTTTAPDRGAGDGSAGAPDLADPLTPGAGNGGYDVAHYDVDLDVASRGTRFDGIVTITATATQDLSSFHLDLRGLEVTRVSVDGEEAATTRSGDELVVTPAAPLAEDAEFTAVVAYGGQPQPVPDPSAPGTIGWLTAPSGSYVAAEPVGAKGFLPCNDHPSDKATFTFTITAPRTDTVVANGVLRDTVESGDDVTWTYDADDPMATYLAQIAVGDYDVVERTGPHGLPIRDVVLRRIPADQRAALDDTADQIEFFETLFGPFPFDTYGILLADADPQFALETQTLTLIPATWFTDFGDTAAVMSHELAHQWFGDAVTPARWRDIWLNEGFATYAEWLWTDRIGLQPLAERVAQVHTTAESYRSQFGAVTDPTPESLFSPNQYDGAAIVLHALRLEIGDDAFFGLLRSWVADHSGTSVTTDDFEAAAATAAGRDLTGFFDAWLRSTTVPPLPR